MRFARRRSLKSRQIRPKVGSHEESVVETASGRGLFCPLQSAVSFRLPLQLQQWAKFHARLRRIRFDLRSSLLTFCSSRILRRHAATADPAERSVRSADARLFGTDRSARSSVALSAAVPLEPVPERTEVPQLYSTEQPGQSSAVKGVKYRLLTSSDHVEIDGVGTSVFIGSRQHQSFDGDGQRCRRKSGAGPVRFEAG